MHRRLRTLTLFAIAIALGTSLAADEPRSVEAKAAATAYRRAVLDADVAHERACAKARQDYNKSMKAALDNALGKKNLEEANRIKAAIDAAGKEGDIQGAWTVSWANGGPTIRYEFGHDKATFDVDRPVHLPSSKCVHEGNTWTYWVSAGPATHVHRYRLSGPYLVGEMWFEVAQFDHGAPPNNICIGRRVEK